MRWFAVVGLVVALGAVAYSQGVGLAVVVSSCGAQTYAAGSFRPINVDTTGKICTH